MKPDLDHWLPDPSLQVSHRRETSAPPDRLWEAAKAVRLRDTSRLGRLVRWRIPGTRPELSFDELFRNPPFIVLDEDENALVSGIVGRIWTLRRDYPQLSDPQEFRDWDQRGTAKVVFGLWVETTGNGTATLNSETRVDSIGAQGGLGLRAVRPLIRAFHPLVGSEGIEAAIRKAQGTRDP